MYKEFPSSPGTESRRRPGTVFENRFSVYSWKDTPRGRAVSLLRQPRCGDWWRPPKVGVEGRGRKWKRGRVQDWAGGPGAGGARSLQIAVDSPGGCQAPHPGHRRVRRAGHLAEQRRRQQRQPRLQAAEPSRERYAQNRRDGRRRPTQ